jgi:ABC-type lipoprotein release transport system permease subunit
VSVFKMAWRNVWRNKRRTLVTVAAMSLALFVMILYSGLIQGYLIGLERNILDLEMGDVQIFADGYRDDPSIYNRIEDHEELLAKLDDAGSPSSARLVAAGLAAAGDQSAGVVMRGVDVERDARVSHVNRHVSDGEWLDPGDASGVVVGKMLARTLGVKKGDEIVVLTQGADGSMANDLYIVRGVLKAISDVVDRGGIFMNQEAFRELMVIPTGVHQIIVRRPAEMELAPAAARVKELAPDHDVKSWRELLPTLASMLDSTSGVMYVMVIIIYTALAIVILPAMLLSVFERIREFGVLKALGVGPGGVLRLILVESGIQTGIALAAGCLLSIPALWYMVYTGIDMTWIGGISISGIAWDPVWKAAVTQETYMGPVVTLVFIVSIAVLYPAVKAAFIAPVSAMRHQ